ncbi:hypothetical protein [Nocardia sp. A7]|uniref:hypothetical protein n=1 Tax=Nocardia sp. A7 TaxID=2789274 RepID=UPI003978174B
MSTDEPTFTGSPWSSLSEYARSHPAGSVDPLRFEPSVARDLAAAASLVIQGINGLREHLVSLGTGKPVSGLGSGVALGTKFGRKATELDGILADHKSILTDMIDTFVAAGKAYGDMDGFNADLLDGIQRDPPGKTVFDDYPAHTPPPVVPTTVALPDSLSGSQAVDSTAIAGESADGMSWSALWEVGNYIRVNQVVATLADQSGGWLWTAGELEGVFADFVDRVDTVTVEQWTGPGKEVAVQAVKAYALAVPRLSAGVRGVGELVRFTAGWLDSTQRSMPPTATNPADTVSAVPPASTNDLPIYRQNFRNTYLTGLTLSSTHVPTLPAADGAFGGIQTAYPQLPSSVIINGDSTSGEPKPVVTPAVFAATGDEFGGQGSGGGSGGGGSGSRSGGQGTGGEPGGQGSGGGFGGGGSGGGSGGQGAGGGSGGQGSGGGSGSHGGGSGGRGAGGGSGGHRPGDESGAGSPVRGAAATTGGQDDGQSVLGSSEATSELFAGDAAIEGLAQESSCLGVESGSAEEIDGAMSNRAAPVVDGGSTGEKTAGSPGSTTSRELEPLSASAGSDLAGSSSTMTPESTGQSTDLPSMIKELLTAAQDGWTQLQETFTELTGALTPEEQQELLGLAGLDKIPGLGGTGGGSPLDIESLLAGAGGGSGGGGGGASLAGPITHDALASSPLLPRVAAVAPVGAGIQFGSTVDGGANPMATPGPPGAAGAAGAGAGAGGQGGNQHRRATFLESTDHLDDAIGDAPAVVRPVVER